jgi:hypothetical protein
MIEGLLPQKTFQARGGPVTPKSMDEGGPVKP